MSLQYPVKKVYITQPWGVNQDAYKKFGLLGHNGIDLRAFLPNGERCYEEGKSEVFAPHAGKVIENQWSTSYGWYVKLENEKEGSILAHFSQKSHLPLGVTVGEGDFVGFQGSTGNSTGIHLHWGYYPIPRNRSNGYSGTIDPLPLLKGQMTETMQINKSDFERLMRASTLGDKLVRGLGIDKNIADLEEFQVDNLITQYQLSLKDLRAAKEALSKEINAHKLTASSLKECQLQKSIPAIEAEVTVAGASWEINGIEVSSDGSVRANYRKK